MEFRVFRLGDSEPIATVEGFVLANAYAATWRALYLCEPVGEHTINSLGVVIDFGSQGDRRH